MNGVAEKVFLSRVAIETLERSTSVRFQTRRTDLTETNQARIQDIGTQPIQKQDERPCPDISFPPFTHLFFVLPRESQHLSQSTHS